MYVITYACSNTSKEHDIQLTNDNQIVSKPSLDKLQKSADQGKNSHPYNVYSTVLSSSSNDDIVLFSLETKD